jgi:hypothetical protein
MDVKRVATKNLRYKGKRRMPPFVPAWIGWVIKMVGPFVFEYLCNWVLEHLKDYNKKELLDDALRRLQQKERAKDGTKTETPQPAIGTV